MINLEPLPGDINLVTLSSYWISSAFIIPWDDTDTNTGAFGIGRNGSHYPFVGTYPGLDQRPAL